MIRNTLPPLLQQLVAPAFQLRGDGLNAGDLLDVHYFDTCRHMITKSRVWQFDDQVGGVVVDVLAELLRHFDGGSDLSRRRCLHSQM